MIAFSRSVSCPVSDEDAGVGSVIDFAFSAVGFDDEFGSGMLWVRDSDEEVEGPAVDVFPVSVDELGEEMEFWKRGLSGVVHGCLINHAMLNNDAQQRAIKANTINKNKLYTKQKQTKLTPRSQLVTATNPTLSTCK